MSHHVVIHKILHRQNTHLLEHGNDQMWVFCRGKGKLEDAVTCRDFDYIFITVRKKPF